ADALASIPIGFLAEKIGYKRSFILVNIIISAAYLIKVVTSNKMLIMAGAFLAGLAGCGNFIIQLPFATHYAKENKNHVFTFLSLVFYISTSFGALIGGSLHSWLSGWFTNEALLFQFILVFFSLFIFGGCIPLFFMDDDQPARKKDISLSPYLIGIDATTIKFAMVELFVGFGLAFVALFITVLYVYYFNSSVEVFGVVSALLVIPAVFFLFVGPSIAEKMSAMKVILVSRFLSIFLALGVVITINVYIGSVSYILFRAIFGLAQSLWFAYAISTATRRSRMATAVWLEITFQIGLGIAALIGGELVANRSYMMLGIFSSASIAISLLLTYFFFGNVKTRLQVE
ncbi:MAG: MFS transporter, partial [Anaerolineaceae bacterium]|nr:MFS transporter [Anaerolineaceae bacterium]